jgi:hypothetical protein
MSVEEVRELMNKLNSGVGKAKAVTAYETKEIEDVDGMLIGMERVDRGTHALGHVGPASPCCNAPGEEHMPECAYGRLDDDNDDAARE